MAADQAPGLAIRPSPKITRELLKTSQRRPEGETPGYITMGGWDEVFEYWIGFGRFWDKAALDWLRDIAAKTQIPSK